MEKSIEEKYQDFLSTISHELRTPLTSIRGFADTMLLSYDKLSDEQKLKFINIIKEQSNRLIDLVENILSVSKLENITPSSFIFKSTSPIKTLNSILPILKNKYPQHKFNITNPNFNENIYVDENKLQQIFLNLIENSAKYSEKIKQTDISFNTNNSKCIIQIRDYGIGIAKENHEKIFEKFSRIDNPLTRKTEGSGLGLYITKILTEKMNGEISLIESDIGSCFEISFELCDFKTASENKMSGGKNC